MRSSKGLTRPRHWSAEARAMKQRCGSPFALCRPRQPRILPLVRPLGVPRMARYQILVTEPNQLARTIEVLHNLTVGRARNSDVVLQDDEVSREQLKIVVAGEKLAVRSIGKTNVTAVDGRPVRPGDDAALRVGSRITAGRTLIEVQAVDAGPGDTTIAGATQVGKSSQPPTEDATLQMPVGPRDGKPIPPAPPTPPAPPAPKPATPANPTPLSEGATLQLPIGPRGGKPGPATPAAPPPAPPPDSASFGDGATLQLPTGPRAGRPAAPPPPPPAPASESATLQIPAGPRAAGPAPTPPPPPPAPSPAPATPVPAAAAPAPEPASSNSGGKGAQPSTVALATVDIDDAANQRLAVLTMQAGKLVPRLFVRSRSLRRSMRIAGPCARVGRNDQSDLVLADESVSENHAEVMFDGKHWTVRDLGSRNGTNVDGQSVTGDSRPIVRNTVLRFGAVHAVFLVDDPARLFDDLRHEARAMRHLLRTGRLTK
ncbi:MAG: FHA domain-containing protein, partial [Planctomycetes bacterium]|nr:FHA domain-containing protein [Planctomycetota bacterium]